MWKWHQRLAHLNSKHLLKLVDTGVVPAIDVADVKSLSCCEICLKGKLTRLPFSKGDAPCTEIVQSGVVGSFRSESLNSAKYFVTFMYQKLVEKQTARRIKYLHSENGRGYLGASFLNKSYCHSLSHSQSLPK